jgi:hypothetical protein
LFSKPSKIHKVMRSTKIQAKILKQWRLSTQKEPHLLRESRKGVSKSSKRSEGLKQFSTGPAGIQRCKFVLLTIQQSSKSGRVEVSLHSLRWSIADLKKAVNSLHIAEGLCPFDTGQSVRKKTNSAAFLTKTVMRTLDSDHAMRVNGMF